jgi:hypothetical protein
MDLREELPGDRESVRNLQQRTFGEKDSADLDHGLVVTRGEVSARRWCGTTQSVSVTQRIVPSGPPGDRDTTPNTHLTGNFSSRNPALGAAGGLLRYSFDLGQPLQDGPGQDVLNVAQRYEELVDPVQGCIVARIEENSLVILG